MGIVFGLSHYSGDAWNWRDTKLYLPTAREGDEWYLHNLVDVRGGKYKVAFATGVAEK